MFVRTVSKYKKMLIIIFSLFMFCIASTLATIYRLKQVLHCYLRLRCKHLYSIFNFLFSQFSRDLTSPLNAFQKIPRAKSRGMFSEGWWNPSPGRRKFILQFPFPVLTQVGWCREGESEVNIGGYKKSFYFRWWMWISRHVLRWLYLVGK